MRKIIHVDMDAFYASVEQRDNPELRGKPVAVGGSSRRGVVAAASYEARKFGVHSALPSSVASRRCPDLIFVKARFDVYKEVSNQIRTIFKEYTDLVEPLSLDEAYLDVTEPKKGPLSATLIARDIRASILEQTSLTASAGVSFNKFLAKVASDLDKPDGLSVIKPEDALSFIADLPIEKFYGVGPATAKRMKSSGVYKGADLQKRSESELVALFGKSGRYYYRIANALDDRPVQPSRIRKSVGAERTFFDDVAAIEDMEARLAKIVAEVHRRCVRSEKSGRTVTIKIRYGDFETRTRRKTLEKPIETEEELLEAALFLLRTPSVPARPVRLLGVTASNFVSEPTGQAQLSLELDPD